MNAEHKGAHKGPKINKKTSPTKWIVAGIGVMLVVIAGIAIVGGGSDDGGSSSDTSLVDDQVSQYQPVTFTGEALPILEDSVPAPGADPAVGMAAPVLSGFGFNGMEMTIRPAGSPVLLVYLAHWCPHCNAEIPRLIEWKESGQMPESLEVVGVATGSRDDQPNWPPSQWLVDMEWPWTVMADSEDQRAAFAMGVGGYPGLVLLDGDGTVLARRSGEASVSELNDWVATALPSA